MVECRVSEKICYGITFSQDMQKSNIHLTELLLTLLLFDSQLPGMREVGRSCSGKDRFGVTFYPNEVQIAIEGNFNGEHESPELGKETGSYADVEAEGTKKISIMVSKNTARCPWPELPQLAPSKFAFRFCMTRTLRP